MFLRLAIIAFGLMAAHVVHAQAWEGKGELGYVLVEGNTKSETLNAALQLDKELERWNHRARLAIMKASSNDIDSAESYTAGWRSEYEFSERFFSFGDIRYFDDRFDSFNEIYTGALGLGYKVLMREGHTWDVSAGLGYRDTSIELTGEDISGVTYLLESDYRNTLTETTELTNYTRSEISQDNTFTQNITSLSVAINSALALKISHEFRHNTNPEPHFRSVDRITSINIVYSF